MKIFEFLSGISFITLVFGLIVNLLMIIPSTIAILFKNSAKTILWAKAMIRIINTSIIVNFIFDFASQKIPNYSLYLYIIGFYYYIILFTLSDESNKEALQEKQKTYTDYIFLKATSYNPFMIIVALIYFILAILIPNLTNFYLPSLFLKLYYWLFSFKIISWIIYVIGVFTTLYVIQYTFFIVYSITKKVFK